MSIPSVPNIEKVVKQTIKAIEDGKNEIYDIAETVRHECERLKSELEEIQMQVISTIDAVDNLERLEKSARLRLMEVSRNYDRYTESEVRDAYEKARSMQVELGKLREREQQLKYRRNEIERSLRKLKDTVEKAEKFVSQAGVVLDYLGGNLKNINNQLEVALQKQQLAPKVIQAQEEERCRVAREIHDGPAQLLANVVLRTEVCEKLLDRDIEQTRNELRELRALVKNSLQEVRRIIFDLRPMALDDLGLFPALCRYLKRIKEQSKVDIQISSTDEQRRLETTHEVAVFRVVQEAVQNSIKHAKAERITIRILMEDERIIVLVRDDGIGFDAENYFRKPLDGNYGMIGMKERMVILGGQLVVRSSRGEGTEVLASLPVKNQD